MAMMVPPPDPADVLRRHQIAQGILQQHILPGINMLASLLGAPGMAGPGARGGRNTAPAGRDGAVSGNPTVDMAGAKGPMQSPAAMRTGARGGAAQPSPVQAQKRAGSRF